MEALTQSDRYVLQTSILRRIGYAVWMVLAVFSIYFFKERAAFMDGAFQLVDLINTESFSIHHNRLTNPFTQILALLAVKLKLPLNYVMLGYSLNFVLFQLFIYYLIVNWCKNDILGLVQVGFFTIFVTQSFYFLPPEFYQGMSILLLWAAILLQPSFQYKWWKFPLLSLLLILIIFDHALLSVFFLFIWIFFWFQNKELRTVSFYALLVVMILVYFVHETYFLSWYDIARKEHFWRHWNQYYPHFENLPGHKVFLKRCVYTYYLFPILTIIIITAYLKAHFNKNANIKSPLMKLCLVLGFCFSYLLLNHINDPNTPFLFYSEVNYMGLAIPLLIPLGFDFLPKLAHKKLIYWGIGLVMLLRVITIFDASTLLKLRHSWMDNTIETSNSNKIYVKSSDSLKKLLIQTWAVPEESLLISSLDDKNNSSTILIRRSDYKYTAEIDSNHVFLRAYSVQPIIELNSDYFNLGGSFYQEFKLED